jgi:SAM-dependent methyltransferase
MQSQYGRQYRDLWERHWWWQARRRFVLAQIARLAAEHPLTEILDIGCGDGLFFPDLSQFGHPWGIEADSRLIDPDGAYQNRIEVVMFDGSYRSGRRVDLVLMLDVLEHIEDDRGALSAVRELLRPGGHLLLTVPALPVLWSMHDVANCHFRRYTRSTLARRLDEAGLDIVCVRHFFSWTVVPMLLRRILAPARSDPARAGRYTVAVPNRTINALCRLASIVEQSLTLRVGGPIGSSLCAIARRRTANAEAHLVDIAAAAPKPRRVPASRSSIKADRETCDPRRSGQPNTTRLPRRSPEPSLYRLRIP